MRESTIIDDEYYRNLNLAIAGKGGRRGGNLARQRIREIYVMRVIYYADSNKHNRPRINWERISACQRAARVDRSRTVSRHRPPSTSRFRGEIGPGRTARLSIVRTVSRHRLAPRNRPATWLSVAARGFYVVRHTRAYTPLDAVASILQYSDISASIESHEEMRRRRLASRLLDLLTFFFFKFNSHPVNWRWKEEKSSRSE